MKNHTQNFTELALILFLAIFISLSSGCSSIEARGKGVAKPFPGIQYMSDSRHSVYGTDGWLKPKPPEPMPLPESDAENSCDWAIGLSAALPLMGDEASAAIVLMIYAPIDLTATLAFDLLMWPADALDNKARKREGQVPPCPVH
ncbi:MAG: hypothetical protein H8E27_10460 [Verrucomicrobia subdivision 3 bacterium]|nr:hypothetical protein [Limisphaerales bacterium]